MVHLWSLITDLVNDQPYVRALNGLLPESQEFLDLAILQPLVQLVGTDEIQLNHEIHVGKDLILSRLQQIVVTHQETFLKMNDAKCNISAKAIPRRIPSVV